MSEASNKASTDAATKPRKVGFPALLGRKPAPDEPEMPAMDVAGGVSRALRPRPSADAPRKDEDDTIRAALATIESALFAVDTLRDILEQALDVVHTASDVDEPGGRALLAESYDDIRLSVTKTIEALDPRAAALIGKAPHNLDVKLGGKAHYSVSAYRLDLSPKGLNLDPPREAFSTKEEIERVVAEIDAALKKADRAASAFCRDAQFLIARMPKEEAAA
jgi:hypothetical protein